MSEAVEITKCSNPNPNLQMCKDCQRLGQSQHDSYESFDLAKTLMNGWQCSGYVSKRESGSLFDE